MQGSPTRCRGEVPEARPAAERSDPLTSFTRVFTRVLIPVIFVTAVTFVRIGARTVTWPLLAAEGAVR